MPDAVSDPAVTAAARPVAEKPAPTEKRSPAESSLPPSEAALKEGIALYNDGNFAAAIRRLNSISGADKPIQIQAHKYAAFSYCVSDKRTLCRQQFEKALKLDPGFDLEPGEKGHPLWGRVFEQVKKRKK
ncbi:TssQ family T6SS-associated lipoprotein [Noviherbaspirillum sp. Root189]|uniref:TssQ family T6SS-associated lipoprotein n=1 Tax=Noviherbaspirillum sp. Root189 TaxID=1736487 RepID=UPI001F1992AA|nr:TssQ family T6SS-associated lipoprotein [Noviherbaspirillum sp. Root189]